MQVNIRNVDTCKSFSDFFRQFFKQQRVAPPPLLTEVLKMRTIFISNVREEQFFFVFFLRRGIIRVKILNWLCETNWPEWQDHLLWCFSLGIKRCFWFSGKELSSKAFAIPNSKTIMYRALICGNGKGIGMKTVRFTFQDYFFRKWNVQDSVITFLSLYAGNSSGRLG